MRKIIGGMFISLDGVIQAPGGPTEDPTGGFEFGGWNPPFWDDKLGESIGKLFDGPFDLLLGRNTYDIFAAHWPFMPEDDPIRVPFDRATKYVLTHQNDKLEWVNSQKLSSIDDVKNLKATKGPNLVIQGSSTIYPELFTAGLLDQLYLMTFPIVLGKGKKLFGSGTPPFSMKLIKTEVSKTGVIMSTYAPVGKVETGSFATPKQRRTELP